MSRFCHEEEQSTITTPDYLRDCECSLGAGITGGGDGIVIGMSADAKAATTISVTLTPHEARELAAALVRFADRLWE